MKAILAAGAFFLPAALGATDIIFDFVTLGCGPCLHQAVAAGPGAVQSKEFAEYFCLGKGADAVALCIPDCKSTSDDVLDIAYARAQVDLIVGAVFDYWYVYPTSGLGTVINP
jgi:hypothetical protein